VLQSEKKLGKATNESTGIPTLVQSGNKTTGNKTTGNKTTGNPNTQFQVFFGPNNMAFVLDDWC
jgi:hypothetical protein